MSIRTNTYRTIRTSTDAGRYTFVWRYHHLHAIRVALPFCSLTLTAQKPSKAPQNPKTLGDHIKRRRLELGLYQTQVGKILGVTECTITNWEKNRSNPTLRPIPKIIEFLGYDPIVTVPITLGEKLQQYRKSRGLNQKQLAKMIGIDPTTLGRIEKNEVKSRIIVSEKVLNFLHANVKS